MLLRSGSLEQRQKIAHLLNLSEPWEHGKLCVEYENVELSKPTLKAGSESALLTTTSSDCDFAFLVPFISTGHGWILAGTVPVWTKYSSPKYRIESLTTPGESEIIVSGQTVDSGTGILQRNLTILKIVGDSIRIIFDQPEEINLSVPVKVRGERTNTREEESSAFSFVNSEPFMPGLKGIQETRVLRIAGQLITIHRKYVWTPSISMFRMYGTGPPDSE
ncbi:MAG TPA: hypothetical protein VKO18_02060 [Terriglobia bacterium]|nr:hypothetical protein [Terriglobia bacterium]